MPQKIETTQQGAKDIIIEVLTRPFSQKIALHRMQTSMLSIGKRAHENKKIFPKIPKEESMERINGVENAKTEGNAIPYNTVITIER